MGSLFGRKKKELENQANDRPKLEQLAYGAAYSLLPHYLYADEAGGTRTLFIESPRVAGIKLLVGASMLNECEPNEQMMKRFSETKGHSGRLSPEVQYRIVEYPKPDPVDVDEFERLQSLPPEQLFQRLTSVILAPYFSILLLDDDLVVLEYLVLGQSPDGATTLRLVEQDRHSNLGPGCKPEFDALIEFLNERKNRESLGQ